MLTAVCVALVCVVLLGNPTSGVPSSPVIFQPDDSAIAARYLLQKDQNFAKGVLDSLQEQFFPIIARKSVEKHRERRAFMVQCCGFYRCINGNKKTTTTCTKDAASFTLPAIGLPTLPPVDGGLLGAVDDLLGGGLPTIPALPTLPPLPSIPLPGDTITILGSGPCPTGYVPQGNGTSLTGAAGSLLGGLLGG